MSENKILRQCFDREELSDKKRPDTVRSMSVCLCLCFLAFLSHSTTNRGVFPSVMVSVWSAGSHSLKNALTLVCPSHTHTHTPSPSPPHCSQCSGLGWPASACVDFLRSSTLVVSLLLLLLLLFVRPTSIHPLRAVFRLISFAPAFQAATQFKASLAKLMEILMSKEPSYVRCIKPNDSKQAGTKSILRESSTNTE